jgi:hypothetical protein
MAFDALTTFVAIAIAAVCGFGLVRSYRRLGNVELVVLWWWAAIAIVALPGVFGRVYVLIGTAGVLMFGLGVFVLLNVYGSADALARRRLAVGLSGLTQRSARAWRVSGATVAAIGAVWMLAFHSAF